MSQPVVAGSADEIYEGLGPLAAGDGDDTEWALLHLVNAPWDIHSDLDAAVRDPVRWSPLFDPDTAPARALPWLAQFVGARLTPAMTEAEQRATITERSSWTRGTPGALISAVKATLTGTKRVTLVERWGGDAYRLAVWTYAAETPSPAGTEAAVLSQKPAGIVLAGTVVQPGLTWYDAAHQYASWTAFAAAGAKTWAQRASEIPTY